MIGQTEFYVRTSLQIVIFQNFVYLLINKDKLCDKTFYFAFA
jgi:hypothetical protein